MRNSFLEDFYKVNPSLDPANPSLEPANQPDDKPADNNDDSSMREAMADFKAGFDAMKQELADTRAELSKYINQQNNADNVDNTSTVDNNEGGADNAS